MEPNEVMTDEQIDSLIDSFEGGTEESGVSVEEIESISVGEVQPEDLPQETEPQEEAQGESDDEQPQQDKQGTGESQQEPGYVRGRIEKAVTRAVAENDAKWQAKFDAVIKPLIERQDEEDAQELVRSRKVGDIETARELIRLRKGQSAEQPAAQQEQPRQANGQFAPKEDPVISARIDILSHQADRIKATTGLDVMSVFDKDAGIKQKVLSGEMDFYEVAEQMKARPAARARSGNHDCTSASTPMPF